MRDGLSQRPPRPGGPSAAPVTLGDSTESTRLPVTTSDPPGRVRHPRGFPAAPLQLLLLAGLVLAGCGDGAPAGPAPAPATGPAHETEAGAEAAPGEIHLGTTPSGAAAAGWFTGTVKGRVTTAGTFPSPHTLRLDGAPEWARGLRDGPIADPAFARNADGSVPDAFVYADRGPHRSILWQVDHSYRPRLEVRDGLLSPRVFGLMTGETLRVVNADPAEHGLVFSGERTGRLVVRAPSAGTIDQTFRVDDVVVAITHMELGFTTGWMFVLEHPFFAPTDAEGRFEMADMPPGDYTFVAWHETFGRTEVDVAVDVDRTSDVAIGLPGPRAASPPPR